MSRTLMFVLSALVSLAFACSSAPKVPTIDNVTFATFTKDATGTYSAVGTVTAHGDGAAVSQLALHVPPQNGVAFADSSFSVAGFASPYQATLKFPSATPAGSYTFQLTAVDTAGARSTPFNGTFTLQ